MKLKTLLLGSAAVMIAVTGARAADAVVAEPEPVEYVRVCDMYGNGFFYIPGTETCLQISGEIRMQYEYTSFNNNVDSTGEPFWYGRVNFDAREETDYGTLRAYIRLGTEDGDHNTESGVSVKDAYIELGGLSTGYRTTRVELGGLPGAMIDGDYGGGGRTMYMDYTFASNGFSATAGVSLDNSADAPGAFVFDPVTGLGIPSTPNAGALGDSKSVDVYGRVDYSSSLFNASASLGYDTSASETQYNFLAAIKPLDGLTIQGYYGGNSGNNQFADGFSGYDSVWGLGASYAVLDNTTVYAGYIDRQGTVAADRSSYTVGVNWTPVPNLAVRAQYVHSDADTGHFISGAATESDEFRVRIQRNF